MSFRAETEREVLLACSKILQHPNFGTYAAATGFNSCQAFVDVVKRFGDDPRPICSLLALPGFDANSLFYPAIKGFCPVDYANRLGLVGPEGIDAVELVANLVWQAVAKAKTVPDAAAAKHILGLVGTEGHALVDFGLRVIPPKHEYVAPFDVDYKNLLFYRLNLS